MSFTVPGSGGLPKLAPTTLTVTEQEFGYAANSPALVPGVFTEVLNRSARLALSYLSISALTNSESYDVRLTIDSEVIIDQAMVAGATTKFLLIGGRPSSATFEGIPERYLVESTILLEIKSTADTLCTIERKLTPIS